MAHNRVMLVSVLLTLGSILMGALTFFIFSPITFFIQLSLGVLVGIAGFFGLMSVLIQRMKKKRLFESR